MQSKVSISGTFCVEYKDKFLQCEIIKSKNKRNNFTESFTVVLLPAKQHIKKYLFEFEVHWRLQHSLRESDCETRGTSETDSVY